MYTNNARLAIIGARKFAEVSGGVLGTEHLLCGILNIEDAAATRLLAEEGVGLSKVAKYIQTDGRKYPNIQNSPRINRMIYELEKRDQKTIGTSDLMLGIISDIDSLATQILEREGVDLHRYRSALQQMRSEEGEDEDDEDQGYSSFDDDEPEDYGEASHQKKDPLEKLGIDLTKKAKEGKLDPVIGRSDEIERVIQILSRRTKNNPVLIGEPGVGKSAIVEGLAQAIVEDKVPEVLKGKIIFQLDMSSVIAGTKYRGEFEEKMQNAIKSIKKAGNIILFIDEIHTIVSAGASEGSSLDVANILKPLLARGELQTIGATTIGEYRKYIEKDSALERRFQPIMVEPPSVEDTVTILKGLRNKYEQHHHVAITDDAIKAAAELSDRYISDRFLPDKAIDLIDEAASKKRITNYVLPQNIKDLQKQIATKDAEKKDCVAHEEFEKAGKLKNEITELSLELEKQENEWKMKQTSIELSIGEDEIADVVSKWTSIPVKKLTESESERLLNLENVLAKRVIGQQEAVSAVSRAVRRAMTGLKDANRPIGSFIFLGPTGVGKTELSKALAEALFGDENLMIRFDMSEYMEKINVSRLIGSAPGYVGYDEGGQLTEKVRRKPYSVVLFDEIEKAHPDVFNLLLQIMEDGRLTDSHGRMVSFKNTVIIMTSNIGASEIKNMPKLGFGTDSAQNDYEQMKERQMKALKNAMRPEFINRLDDIIIFHKLDKENIRKIEHILLGNLAKKLEPKNITLQLSQEAQEFLIEKGTDLENGARPLRRMIERYLEDMLSEELLKGNVSNGDNIKIDVKSDKLGLEIVKE